jgi:hypothetical protein
MEWLHLILNLTALLLWVHWRNTPTPAVSAKNKVFGTLLKHLSLRLARGSVGLLLLVALLVGRAWFYHRIAPEVDWQPRLTLITYTPLITADLSLPFAWADFGKQLAFSVVSFASWLVLYNFVLVFCSVLKPDIDEARGWRHFLRGQLGIIDRLPNLIKIPLTLTLGAGVHYGAAWWLMQLNIMPPQTPEALMHLASGMAVLDLRVVAWCAMALLGLYILNSYIYFGAHKFWKIIESSGQRLLQPFLLFPMKWGRVDFAPLAGLALAWGSTLLIQPEQLNWLYQRLAG